jgi:hypothetical protein
MDSPEAKKRSLQTNGLLRRYTSRNDAQNKRKGIGDKWDKGDGSDGVMK